MFKMKNNLSKEKISGIKIDWINKYANGTVLDAGCGVGAVYSKYLKGKSFDVFSIDKVNVGKISNHIKASVDAVSFNPKQFDTILLFDVLEHTKNDEKTLKEMWRVLKDSGILIMSVPNSNDESLHKYNLTYKHHIDKSHFREYSKKGILELLRNNGFTILKSSLEGPVKSSLIAEFVPRVFRKFVFLALSGLQKIGILKNKELFADIFVVCKKSIKNS